MALAASAATQTSYIPELPSVVVYEANLRAIAPRNSFRVLASRLENLKALGVNVVWLMPVQPVGKLRSAGGLGSPYAVQDFKAVNPEFGNEGDLKDLVKQAHRLHMGVILDWVGDHTSWDNPWIAQHPDWYLKDAQGQIEPPPGTAWNDVAALDYRSAPMRRQMISDMEGWIERDGVDGFRCDACDRLPADFWRTDVDAIRASTPKRLLMLAEGARPEDYASGFDLTYGWEFNSKLRAIFGGESAVGLAGAAAHELRDVPPERRTLRFITNHDLAAWDGSLLDFFKSPDGVRAAFAITALYGGTPLIYCGQEVGWPSKIPIFEDTAIDWKANPSEARWMGRLMSIRDSYQAFKNGNTQDYSGADIVAFTRTQGSEQALVVANVRNRDAEMSLPATLQGVWNDPSSRQDFELGPILRLTAYSQGIYLRPNGTCRRSCTATSLSKGRTSTQ